MKGKKATPKTQRRESTPYLEAIRQFDEGVKALHAKSHKKAQEVFEKVIAEFPEEKEIADRARMYIRICENSRAQKGQALESAEDYYTRGNFRLNAGDYDGALEDLQEAARLDGKADHVPYAAAAAYLLKGEMATAAKSLEKAIKLNPENRVHALTDEDFRALVDDPDHEGLFEADAT